MFYFATCSSSDQLGAAACLAPMFDLVFGHNLTLCNINSMCYFPVLVLWHHFSLELLSSFVAPFPPHVCSDTSFQR